MHEEFAQAFFAAVAGEVFDTNDVAYDSNDLLLKLGAEILYDGGLNVRRRAALDHTGNRQRQSDLPGAPVDRARLLIR